MKTAITIIFTFLLATVQGQTEDYKVLLDSAKTLFKSEKDLDQEETDKFDYHKIAGLLEKSVALNPKSAEARYFLAYAYSRINSSDARGMISMNLELMYKSSEQLEKVIELTPKYTNEIIALDPYAKLTSEWGSMAMSYWHNDQKDLAVWAFGEGRKRGGFGNFILELNRKVLDACGKDAILISSGDSFSIPLWYLQIVENYRTDVSVVDVSLLNTKWYPAFLSKTNAVSFDLPGKVLDTLEYAEWKDTPVTITNFTWTVKPSYYDQYLLRGDLIFLSLLKQNKFQRDLYFTIGFSEESRLGLNDYLKRGVFIDQLTVFEESSLDYPEYMQAIAGALKLSEKLNLNSQDDVALFDLFRYDIFSTIDYYLTNGENGKAQELLQLLDSIVDERKIPYQAGYCKKLAAEIRQRI